jgi:hypothetical protein
MVETVEQELPIPQTDVDKIKWLWDRLDELTQANANLASENDMLTKQNERIKLDLENQRKHTEKISADIIQMGVELNNARAAAATAVEEYRRNAEI